MTKFVVYSCDDEVIVTTEEMEAAMLEEYGIDRDFETDYDREVVENVSAITVRPNIRYKY